MSEMPQEFYKHLRDFADTLERVERGELSSPQPTESPLTTSTVSQGAVEISVRDGEIAAVEIDASWFDSLSDDELAERLTAALNEALTDHERAVANMYLEAGGQRSAMSELWRAQSYASSALMMELDEELRSRVHNR